MIGSPDSAYYENRAVMERRRSETAADPSAAKAHAALADAYSHRARAAREQEEATGEARSLATLA